MVGDIDLSTFPSPAGFAINGAAMNDQSGWSVKTAGDVNGDGIDDVIVGSLYASPVISGSARSTAGISYVLFGRSQSANIAASYTNINLLSLNTAGSTLGFAILGAVASDNCGWSVSTAGDVNGDGLSDVIVGANNAGDPDTRASAGNSYVIFGRSKAANMIASFANVNLLPLNTAGSALGFAIFGAASYDGSGYSVSTAGDVNGDGLSDVIVGSTSANPVVNGVTRSQAGISYVIFGRNKTVNLVNSYANIDLLALNSAGSALGFAIFGAVGGDYSGFTVSTAGDVNGDGLSDVIVGSNYASPVADGFVRGNAGMMHVLFGRSKAASFVNSYDNIDLLPLNTAGSALGFAILGAVSDDYNGYSVSAAGDVNGDGLSDVIVGAYYASPTVSNVARSSAGMVYVLFGRRKSTSLAASYATIDLLPLNTAGSALGFAIVGAASLDYSGNAVSGAGDVNGDGLVDIIVGAYMASPTVGSSNRANAGITYVIFGRHYVASNPTWYYKNIDLGAAILSPLLGFRILGAVGADQSGYFVSAAGDVNEDGLADVIVGARKHLGVGTASGASYVIFGALSSPTSQPSSQPSSRPSRQPSSQPSRHPSAQPSSQPSRQPICRPTSKPSGQPSGQPSRQPTAQPTVRLSAVPSGQPSRQPSSQPSRQPSSQPSRQPSSQPSSQPSRQPSSQPSRQPSRQPSSQPSRQPSRQPSGQPSSQPSSRPTSQPTYRPTMQPSAQPSQQPSTRPSACPSVAPTTQPSSRPSCQPSNQPTEQPSGTPSTRPSARPSGQPSVQPITQPSQQPSRQPSRQPSSQPSGVPSAQPSAAPSSVPSRQPSVQPSAVPSTQPAARPSSQPTQAPSAQPTTQPSDRPSSLPTGLPSAQPISQPTTVPSAAPSAQPSGAPSSQPTSQPSRVPTVQPSFQPSRQPSSQPSQQLRAAPSTQPTGQPTTVPSARPTNALAGEWATVVSPSLGLTYIAYASVKVWSCGERSEATATTCVLLAPLTGNVESSYQLDWDSVTAVLSTSVVNNVVIVGKMTTGTVVTSEVATCTTNQGRLNCQAQSFYDTNFLAASYVPYPNKIVLVGWSNVHTSITMRDVETGLLQSFIYKAANMKALTLSQIQSPPAFVGSFIAGTAIRATAMPVSYIVVGMFRTDSGSLRAMAVMPVSGDILNTANLVNTMALEYVGPDSFIAGGLQLADVAGTHAYLLRANALFGTISYCVRYTSLSGDRRALSSTSNKPQSVARGMVRMGDALFMILDLASHNVTALTVLKTNIADGSILQQVHINPPLNNTNFHCTGITVVDLYLSIVCTIENNGSSAQSLVLKVDQALSFTKLPAGYVRSENIIFQHEILAFKRTVLTITQTVAVLAPSPYEFNTADQTPTRRPSLAPSYVPTSLPSSVPSSQPSSSPTAAPSVSARPTSQPSSAVPTITHRPTSEPTVLPTKKPFTTPTARPSFRPSVISSARPTELPTVSPTTKPRMSPTVPPSRLPSVAPTITPTRDRTQVVSSAPSWAPTTSADFTDSGHRDSSIPSYVVGASVGGGLGALLIGYVLYRVYEHDKDEKARAERHADFMKKQALLAEQRDAEIARGRQEKDRNTVFTLHEEHEHAGKQLCKKAKGIKRSGSRGTRGETGAYATGPVQVSLVVQETVNRSLSGGSNYSVSTLRSSEMSAALYDSTHHRTKKRNPQHAAREDGSSELSDSDGSIISISDSYHSNSSSESDSSSESSEEEIV